MANRVLYICSPFFGYYKHIKAEFEARGYTVDYYNDRPSENSFIKGMQKVKKGMTASLIERYFNSIMAETEGIDYDIVFIMNCKSFTKDMIIKLRERQKSARFVLYMWDTVALYPDAVQLIPIFDKAYSFDSEDCDKNERLELLPLYYTRPYEQIGAEKTNRFRYDIMSVCTAHPNRYQLIKALFPILEAKGIRVFSYLYINHLQYLYNRIYINEFKHAKIKEFKFTPLSEQENRDILRISGTVFDVQHNMQSGLTIRTIETVGAKRKLITTNGKIKDYDLFDDNNIYILDESNWDGIEDFIRREYKPIPEDVYRKYSIGSWIDTILR